MLLEWCSEKTEDDKQERPKWVQGGTGQRERGDTKTGRVEQWGEKGKGDRGEEKKNRQSYE